MSKEKKNVEKKNKFDSNRVYRGGSWFIDTWLARVSDRGRRGALNRYYDLSFRFVLQRNERKDKY